VRNLRLTGEKFANKTTSKKSSSFVNKSSKSRGNGITKVVSLIYFYNFAAAAPNNVCGIYKADFLG
jgi:hypothetical protein